MAATALAISSVGLVGPGVAAQGNLMVTAGVGEGTVAGQAYLPGEVTVAVGDSVTFVIGSDDPHTITTGQGPADAPPFAWPMSGFEPPAEGPPPYDLGTATTDGSAFINTGILFGVGSSATIEFTAPGSYPIFCAIHPGMAGEVTVVEDGPATTQEEADAAAALTRELLLEAEEPLRAERLASTTSVETDDGTTWMIFADASTPTGPLPGGGAGYLELTEFLPPQIEISAGDTVNWTADRIHTVTFLPEGTDPAEVFPSEEAAVMPLGDGTFDGSQPQHSGFLGIPGPDGVPVTSVSVTFPEPGTYPYFCVLHASLGQLGTVVVS